MKTLYIFFIIFILFLDVGLTQQEKDSSEKNGWELTGVYGKEDSTTKTWLEKNSYQVFENSGIPMIIQTFKILQMRWCKQLQNHIIPDTISGEFILENGINFDSVNVYITIWDSLDNWYFSGKTYTFHPNNQNSFKTFLWDLSSTNLKSFCKIGFSFQFITHDTLQVRGIIKLRNLIGTTGANKYVIDPNLVVTGISDLAQTPKEFELSQNYPNPFNPSTKIKFTIPKTGQVDFIIYNSLGQEVQTLVSEERDIGNYEVSFNASNLPSGIYFYKLRAGGFVETKKMILMK